MQHGFKADKWPKLAWHNANTDPWPLFFLSHFNLRQYDVFYLHSLTIPFVYLHPLFEVTIYEDLFPFHPFPNPKK